MAVVILQGPHFGIVGGRESRHWHSEFNDCCSPDCAFCCEIYCCSPCKFGRIAEALPPGSALCAGNCCGAGVLYGALGSVVYSAAVVGAFFFGLGCALSGATGFMTGCYHGHMRRAFRRHFGIEDEPGCDNNDYCVAIFCDLCALCQETRELELRQRALVYARPFGATVLQAPGQVRGMYPGIQMNQLIPPMALGQPVQAPAQMTFATVAQPAQGMPFGGGIAQGQPGPGAPPIYYSSGAGSSSGGAESLEQYVQRLGLPPSVAGQLREVGVNAPADMVTVDDRRLDSAGIKPAFKAVLLRSNRPQR